MDIQTTSAEIVDAALQVHKAVGPGMLESTYESMLAYDLMERGLSVERQKYIEMSYKQLSIERAFCIDLLVSDCVIVEVKSVEALAPAHFKQLLTYLRMTDMRLGLLINFGQITLKAGGIRRIINSHPTTRKENSVPFPFSSRP